MAKRVWRTTRRGVLSRTSLRRLVAAGTDDWRSSSSSLWGKFISLLRLLRMPVVSLFFLASLVSLVVILALYRPVAQPRLSIVSSVYRQPLLPLNAFADRDAAALADMKDVFNNSVADPASASYEDIMRAVDLLPRSEKKFSFFGRKTQAAIIYVNAVGLALPDEHQSGQLVPYILPDDFPTVEVGNPTRLDRAIPVTLLMDRLAQSSADFKVLVLDCQRLNRYWPDGILDNQFVQRIIELVGDRDDLHVICSCSPGETTWVDPASRHSVFGRFFLQAMTGAADAAGESVDQRTTLKEVFDYVAKRTDDWAVANRNARQRPRLLGSGDPSEVVISALGLDVKPYESAPLTEKQVELRNELLATLSDYWKAYYRRVQANPLIGDVATQELRRLEATLLKAEALFRADSVTDLTTLLSQMPVLISELDDQTAKQFPDISTEGASLAELAHWRAATQQIDGAAKAGSEAKSPSGDGGSTEPDGAANKPSDASPAEPGDIKPEDKKSESKEAPNTGNSEPPEPDTQAKKKPLTDAEIEELVRAVVRGDSSIWQAGQELAERVPRGKTLPVEAELLRMFAQQITEPATPQTHTSLSQQIRRILSSRLLAESVTTEGGITASRIFRWLRSWISEGDQIQRVNEDLALATDGFPIGDNADLPTDAGDRYRAVRQHTASIQAAYAAWVTALQDLSYLLEYLASQAPLIQPDSVDAAAFDDVMVHSASLLDAAERLTEIFRADPSIWDDTHMQRLTKQVIEAHSAVTRIVTRGRKRLEGIMAAGTGAGELQRPALGVLMLSLRFWAGASDQLPTFRARLLSLLMAQRNAAESSLKSDNEDSSRIIRQRLNWIRRFAIRYYSLCAGNQTNIVAFRLQAQFLANEIQNGGGDEGKASQLVLMLKVLTREDRMFLRMSADFSKAFANSVQSGKLPDGEERKTVLTGVLQALNVLLAPETDNVSPGVASSWSNTHLQATQPITSAAEYDELFLSDVAYRVGRADIVTASGDSQGPSLGRLHRDRSDYFVWQGRRRLDDFWRGPANSTRPYFASAVQRYQRLAKHFTTTDSVGTKPADDSAADANSRNLQDDLAQRIKMAEEFAKSDLTGVLRPKPSYVEFRGIDQSEIDVSLNPERKLPPGVPNLSGSVTTAELNVDRQPVQQQDNYQFKVQRNGLSGGRGAFRATLHFRGHQAQVNVPINLIDEAGAPSVVFRQDTKSAPVINLHAARATSETSNVLFVLDLSRSMRESGRLQVLQNTLLQFRRILSESGLNVGIRTFGEQVVWDGRDPQVELQARKDTRLVLPIQPAAGQKFEAIVTKLQSKGETPLFYSLIESRKDFDAIAGGYREIVLISDGADNWSSVGLKPGLLELQSAFKDANIRINCVGFQTDVVGYEQLKRIATITGGTCVKAEEASQLLSRILGSVRVHTYSIARTTNENTKQEVYSGLLKFDDDPVVLPGAGTYSVKVLNSQGQMVAERGGLRLRDGQKLELLNVAGRVEYPPINYEQDVAVVSSSDESTRFRVIQAEHVDGNLNLQFALVKPSDRAWLPQAVELTIRPKDTDRSYTFRGTVPNVSQVSFPAWSIQLQQWPKTSKLADITVSWREASQGDAPGIPMSWKPSEADPILPNRARMTRREYGPRMIDGKSVQSALLTLVSENKATGLDGWSFRFDAPIQYSRQRLHPDGVLLGEFIFKAEQRPASFVVIPPSPNNAKQTISAVVRLQLNRINR